MPSFRPLLLVAVNLLLASPVLAQIPNATDTTTTPQPGGHNYLHSPVETVNPANGSVSIRIPVRMAQGRQFALPFSFAYDSNGAHYIGEAPAGSPPTYETTTTAIGQLGGWSYTYPVLSFVGGTFTIPGSNDHNITCHGSTNYVFQDANGDRHNLGLSVSPNIQSPDGFDNCNQGLQGDGEHTTGGEGPILATTTLPSGGSFFGVDLWDGNGTHYALPGGEPGTAAITTLATSVTDRNGNTVTISNSSGAVTYTDTIGRTALHTSGIGANPDTITVGGLSSPYSVHWTTATASFNLNMLNLEPGVPGVQPCPTSMSGNSKVASSIVLPDGRQFTFTYDPTYGMVQKIVYPSGGYVRYVLGPEPPSRSA